MAKRKSTKQLSDGPDWSFELLEQYEKEIDRVANHYKLNTYPNQIEVITAEQMMDAYNREEKRIKSSRQFALSLDYLPQSLSEILKGRRDYGKMN